MIANGDPGCSQDETSELFIGEWMEVRGIRDQMVIATKVRLTGRVLQLFGTDPPQFSNNYKSADKNIPAHARINYTGNSAKSMHISVRDSLKKLRTDYIDLLYVHWWSFDTSIVELMNSLHDLVVAKKVLYLGASDTPAWIVAQANQYALDHGKTPFSVYQGSWNVMDRSFERDIIPMARQWGMALCPWNVLVGGKLRSDAEEERRRKSEKGRDLLGGGWERTPEEKTMVHALEKVANEIGSGVSLTAGEQCASGRCPQLIFRLLVAIAYVMQKTPYVVPIIGGRKAEHLMENAKALEISLSPEQIAFIEGVVPFDPGFPHTMIVSLVPRLL